ncbi:MAG: DUF3784 domain-containing protein [Bacteroidales bacterium]|nr:DUF3784 domain-containing protein [Bacteroidales bacterium]
MLAAQLIVFFTAGLVVGLGILILIGKGANLIAGYNTATEEEKAEFDEKKLNRIVGICCIISGLLVLPIAWVHSLFYGLFMTFAIIILSIVTVVLSNTWAKRK